MITIQKLRDMYLHELADELEQLRKFKAEVEKQEPVGLVKTVGDYPDESYHPIKWVVKHRELKEGQSLHAKQIPANKPVVAVPDKKPLPVLMMAAYHEAKGWNDCIDAMMSTPPHSQQSDPIPWIPVLKNRADGVDGHYAIGRFNPLGYWEFWSLISHKWASASDEVLTLDEANNLLREITLSTGPAAVTVLDDYKLMPKQITEEMAYAFWAEYTKDRGDLLTRCYRALYETAPSHSHNSEPVKEFNPRSNSNTDCAVAAIKYALANDEPAAFLQLWMQGEFDALRKEWDNIPEAVFIGAEVL